MLDRQPGFPASFSLQTRLGLAVAVLMVLSGGTALAFGVLGGNSKVGKTKPSVLTPVTMLAAAPSTSTTDAASPPRTPAHSEMSTSPAAAVPKATKMSSRPEVLVATSKLGRMVTIDTTTGETTRVLVQYDVNKSEPNIAISNVDLSADGKTVYFQKSLEGNEIWRISVGNPSAEPVKIVDGISPSLSPDGTALAYFKITTLDANSVITHKASLHILHLLSGKDTLLEEQDIGCECATAIAWAPDNRHLATQEDGDDQFYGDVRIVDTQNSNTDVIVPKPHGQGGFTRQWTLGAFLPDGTLLVVEQPSDAQWLLSPGRPSSPVMVIDPVTGRPIRTVTIGVPGRFSGWTATDASGRHLVYLSDNDLMVSDDGAPAVRLATGVTSADW